MSDIDVNNIDLKFESKTSERMLQAVKTSFSWLSELEEANVHYVMGEKEYETAILHYALIFEAFLRNMYKELSLLVCGKDKERLAKVERSVCGIPVFKMTFGQLIRLYEITGFLTKIQTNYSICNFELSKLRELNEYRVDSVHWHDSEKAKQEIEKLRMYATQFLISLNFITKDPFPNLQQIKNFEKNQGESHKKEAARKVRISEMQKIARQTWLRVVRNDQTVFGNTYMLEKEDGWLSADVQYRAEIIGAWFDEKEEKLKTIVVITDFSGPDTEWDAVIEKVWRKTGDVMVEETPEIQDFLQIHIFDINAFKQSLSCALYSDE